MTNEPAAGIRETVLRLFEQHRATPGAPYAAEHFLDHLLANPARKRAVYDSFRGLRRFNAFLDAVQYEFAVCFSLKDREANYSLDAFVHRVMELQQSRRGSLMSLDRQAAAGAGSQVLVVANLVLLIAGVWLKDLAWALALLVGLAVALNGWFFWFTWRARAYLARLRIRIEAAR
jgi:hypothetical protein